LADPSELVDVDALVAAYYDARPDPSVPEQRVAFGTSGHRGTSPARTFTEAHVLAISEAVRFRTSGRCLDARGMDRPLLCRASHHLQGGWRECRSAGEVAARRPDSGHETVPEG
jgi:phosphoglucomutase